MWGFLMGVNMAVITLMVDTNGNELRVTTESVETSHHVAVKYYMGDVLRLVVYYDKDNSIESVFDDIGQYMNILL